MNLDRSSSFWLGIRNYSAILEGKVESFECFLIGLTARTFFQDKESLGLHYQKVLKWLPQ